ncbi:MAG: hypothetical protein HRU01_19715 [Myxococcales bacterium]|nr:hypothetical protein [Myxococcales bacterium]
MEGGNPCKLPSQEGKKSHLDHLLGWQAFLILSVIVKSHCKLGNKPSPSHLIQSRVMSADRNAAAALLSLSQPLLGPVMPHHTRAHSFFRNRDSRLACCACNNSACKPINWRKIENEFRSHTSSTFRRPVDIKFISCLEQEFISLNAEVSLADILVIHGEFMVHLAVPSHALCSEIQSAAKDSFARRTSTCHTTHSSIFDHKSLANWTLRNIFLPLPCATIPNWVVHCTSINSELKIKCLPLSSGPTEPLGPSIWTSPSFVDTDRHWQQFLSSKFKVGVQDNCFRFAWFQDCLPVCTHHPPHFMDKNDLLQCINSALVIACNFKVKKEMLSLLSENIDDTDDSRHCKRNKRKLKQMD